MARRPETSIQKIAAAEKKVEEFLKSGNDTKTTDWALAKFDSLFTADILTPKSHRVSRKRIEELYSCPDIVPEEQIESLYVKEFEFILNSIVNSKIPESLKQTFIQCYKLSMNNGRGAFVPKLKNDNLIRSFAKQLNEIEFGLHEKDVGWQLQLKDYLDPSKGIQEPEFKIPVSVSEHVFKSSFYSNSFKTLLLPLSKKSRKEDFMKMWSEMETYDFFTRHTYFRMIGIYLVLIEHFELQDKIRNSQKRSLPYLHKHSISIIEKYCDWRLGSVSDDLEKIFNP